MNEFYYILFQLMLVMLVLVALIQYINFTASGLRFEKRFASMDIALLTTTVQYVPGTMKYLYTPMPFEALIDLEFINNTIYIIQKDSDLPPIIFWSLANINRDSLRGVTRLTGTKEDEGGMFSDAEITPPEITYYRTGRKTAFDHTEVNPFQKDCPVFNTSANIKSKTITISKVFKDAKDERNETHPINMIAQYLSARHKDIFKITKSTETTGSAGSGKTSDLIIYLGDSGESKGPGSMVMFIPIDENTLFSRKLACSVINDLLTEKSNILFSQIMPIYTEHLDKESPLNALKSKAAQATIFWDISGFTSEQIDYHNTADALATAILRYYGAEDLNIISEKTMSTEED
ncbi:MAG: hypothetical protein V1729_01795 [Candidatus Woesearchaeota archaeon]